MVVIFMVIIFLIISINFNSNLLTSKDFVINVYLRVYNIFIIYLKNYSYIDLYEEICKEITQLFINPIIVLCMYFFNNKQFIVASVISNLCFYQKYNQHDNYVSHIIFRLKFASRVRIESVLSLFCVVFTVFICFSLKSSTLVTQHF